MDSTGMNTGVRDDWNLSALKKVPLQIEEVSGSV